MGGRGGGGGPIDNSVNTRAIWKIKLPLAPAFQVAFLFEKNSAKSPLPPDNIHDLFIHNFGEPVSYVYRTICFDMYLLIKNEKKQNILKQTKVPDCKDVVVCHFQGFSCLKHPSSSNDK